ncbi:sigma-70 family RNA polymerase sigma factor [Lacimicrobium sp. SS2-24]|uniref:RNA polymerase sigma factor n=1 Tax=Lacimicrobium sp. SS2-24 TaxID=2005569 RepID=UPI000B4A68E9|nr:sigma-70 family RNA polymerase sigma factor [Lacimicrobium sp. SS2-24]
MFSTTDASLISKALDGNNKAWLKLIKRYEKNVYHYGLRMTGSADDAMDLMQEVFISVFRNLSGFRGDGSFKSWLFRIAHFRCVEFYRRKRSHQSLDEGEEIVDHAACASQPVFDQAQSRDLIAAMQALPLEQKAVVELKFFGQFTFEEIADQLGVSVNTIKSRLYSALGKMKTHLEDIHD